MAVQQQAPQRELWSMEPLAYPPSPSQPTNANAVAESLPRYAAPTPALQALWTAPAEQKPAAQPSSPQPVSYKFPSALGTSTADMRSVQSQQPAASKGFDEDLNSLLNGLSTPAPTPAPSAGTHTVAPSFPTQTSPSLPPASPQPPMAQPSPLANRFASQLQQQLSPSPPPPSTSTSASASSAVSPAELSVTLSAFMRKAEDNFAQVTRHLGEIERRLNSLELTTKEILENQKTSAAEKKKQLDALHAQLNDMRRQASGLSPLAPQQPAQAQPQAAQPSLLSSIPSSYAVAPAAPPPAYASQFAAPSRLPPLQPATALYPPTAQQAPAARPSARSQEEEDRQLALRLQEEMNRETATANDLLPGPDTARMNRPTGVTPGGPSHTAEASSECPICGMDQPLSQVEAHVNQHLEKNPNAVTPEQKEGFFSWLFSGNKKPAAAAAPVPPKLNERKPVAPSVPPQRLQSQQVINLNQPNLYPGNSLYRYPTSPMQGLPPGMQLATIPPGAPIPPGAVPLNPSMYPQMYSSAVPQQQPQMYYSQLPQP